MIVCWSAKGGSGTSVVASVLALEIGRARGSAVLGDAGGDAATILGLDVDSQKPGLHQWLSSPPSVPLEGARRLLVEVTPELRLLPPGPAGDGSISSRQAGRLASVVDGDVVVDAGRSGNETTAALIDSSTTSIAVLRSCFLGVRRTSNATEHFDGFVLVEEDGRSLDVRDVEDVLGAPALATVRYDPAVARLVDAGRMKSRLPRSLRTLQKLARTLADAGHERVS